MTPLMLIALVACGDADQAAAPAAPAAAPAAPAPSAAPARKGPARPPGEQTGSSPQHTPTPAQPCVWTPQTERAFSEAAGEERVTLKGKLDLSAVQDPHLVPVLMEFVEVTDKGLGEVYNAVCNRMEGDFSLTLPTKDEALAEGSAFAAVAMDLNPSDPGCETPEKREAWLRSLLTAGEASSY